MKTKLKEFCRSIGIDSVGIAPAGPYPDLEKILKERIKGGYYTGFEEADLIKRVDPSATMEDVKSIIVCLFPYFTGHADKSNISKYTYGIDYHLVAREKLESIGKYLSENIRDFKYRIYVDSGPLVDRYLAHLAGLGFYGINNLIINDKYGSYVSIGYILCNYPFESDRPVDRSCAGCSECIRKCPGGAILGEYSIDPVKCISYITQKKGELSDDEAEALRKGEMVFGCDICQDVCPHNKQAQLTGIEEFKNDLINHLDYEEIKSMSNKEFKRKYGNRAFSWRGKSIILRNFEKLKGSNDDK